MCVSAHLLGPVNVSYEKKILSDQIATIRHRLTSLRDTLTTVSESPQSARTSEAMRLCFKNVRDTRLIQAHCNNLQQRVKDSVQTMEEYERYRRQELRARIERSEAGTTDVNLADNAMRVLGIMKRVVLKMEQFTSLHNSPEEDRLQMFVYSDQVNDREVKVSSLANRYIFLYIAHDASGAVAKTHFEIYSESIKPSEEKLAAIVADLNDSIKANEFDIFERKVLALLERTMLFEWYPQMHKDANELEQTFIDHVSAPELQSISSLRYE